MSNEGKSALTVNAVLYSESEDGPFETWDGEGALSVGKFTVHNVPSTFGATSSATLAIQFNSTVTGAFYGFVKFKTSSGNGTFSIQGSAGPAPVALLEFKTPDADDWATYTAGTPFTFGNVTQNTARSLKFRVTNDAAEGGVRLYLTVSKPPFGVSSVVHAANQADLAEGTSLSPGESASAVLTCSVAEEDCQLACKGRFACPHHLQ